VRVLIDRREEVPALFSRGFWRWRKATSQTLDKPTRDDVVFLRNRNARNTTNMKLSLKTTVALCGIVVSSSVAFAPAKSFQSSVSALHFFKGGSGAKDLDEEVSCR
jgi:hypothetical protein